MTRIKLNFHDFIIAESVFLFPTLEFRLDFESKYCDNIMIIAIFIKNKAKP